MKCGEFDVRNRDYSNIFTTKKYFRRLLLGEAYEELKYNTDGKGKIIFDVGAHKGESVKFFHDMFPAANIHSFEPNPFAAESISNLRLPNIFVHQLALSDFDGSAEFNIQDISHLSSLHKINHESQTSLGYAKEENHRSICIEVMRGDAFMQKNHIDSIDLLKIDVQANEVKTLLGFSAVIDKVKVVFVEVSIYDLYENYSTIGEIEKSLSNFKLFDIYEISKNPKTLGTDWITLVYKNTIE